MVDIKAQAGDLFRQGKLTEAVAAATQAVKAAPADLGQRILLAEMLVFAGNLERADVILDAASQVDPTAAVIVAEFRQLLRAETARRQLYRDGSLARRRSGGGFGENSGGRGVAPTHARASG
jgi:type VI secretion system protein ImpE